MKTLLERSQTQKEKNRNTVADKILQDTTSGEGESERLLRKMLEREGQMKNDAKELEKKQKEKNEESFPQHQNKKQKQLKINGKNYYINYSSAKQLEQSFYQLRTEIKLITLLAIKLILTQKLAKQSKYWEQIFRQTLELYGKNKFRQIQNFYRRS